MCWGSLCLATALRLLATLRCVTGLPPVVAMTGNTSLSDMLLYQSAGFAHLLGKPFDADGLCAALRVCVKSVVKPS